jgi:hypothetical protein
MSIHSPSSTLGLLQMTSKTHIQKDWEQREFIAEMTTNVKKLVDFLNNFGI